MDKRKRNKRQFCVRTPDLSGGRNVWNLGRYLRSVVTPCIHRQMSYQKEPKSVAINSISQLNSSPLLTQKCSLPHICTCISFLHVGYYPNSADCLSILCAIYTYMSTLQTQTGRWHAKLQRPLLFTVCDLNKVQGNNETAYFSQQHSLQGHANVYQVNLQCEFSSQHFFLHAMTILVGHALLMVEVSRLHSYIQSTGLLQTTDLRDAETSTLQHLTLLKERHPGSRSPYFVNNLRVKMVSRRAS